MEIQTARQAQGSNPGLKKQGALSGCLPIAFVQSLRKYGSSAWNGDIDGRFSASLVCLREASSQLNREQKVRFVRYAQFRIRWAVLGGSRHSNWNASRHWQAGSLAMESIQNLSSFLECASTQGELAAEPKFSLDVHGKQLAERNGLPIEKTHGSCEREAGCIPSRLEDEPLFRYLRAEIAERFPEGSCPESKQAARSEDCSGKAPGKVPLPRPNLARKLKACWERLPIAARSSKRLGHRRLPWNAEVDHRFAAALAGLEEVSAKLEAAQKLQLVGYAQFRIQREILQELRQ